MFLGDLGHRGMGLGVGDLWAEQGWVGDGIFGYSGDGFGESLGTEGWVWGWGIFGQGWDVMG